MPAPASSTTVGAGGRSPRGGGGGAARPAGGGGGGTVRQRKTTSTTAARTTRPSTSTGSMWRFYTATLQELKLVQFQFWSCLSYLLRLYSCFTSGANILALKYESFPTQDQIGINIINIKVFHSIVETN